MDGVGLWGILMGLWTVGNGVVGLWTGLDRGERNDG